jgi:flagellin-like hook-associated protein FlgL
MMNSKFLSEANKALNRVDKYQSQVNSTKRLSGIADDPQSTLMALRARDKLSNLELYQANIATANSYLKEAESATRNLNTLLQSAYESIISAQGAKTPEDLKIFADNIKNLQDEVLSISNSSLGTSYIFGGYNYTGKAGGTSREPPFSVDDVTGDLFYNGINLSKISWKGDFDAGIRQMTDQLLTDPVNKTDLRSTASAFSSDYAAYSDTYAKSEAQKILKALDTILAGAGKAMAAAYEYGIDSEEPNFVAFKAFYDDLAAVKNELSQEISKDYIGSYILDTDVPAEHKLHDGSIDYDYYRQQGINVYTADERDNLLGSIKFNKERIYNILNLDAATIPADPARPFCVYSLLTGDGTAPSRMTAAISLLSADVKIPDSATDFTESIKRVTIQAGGTDIPSLISAYDPASEDPVARAHAQKILGPLKAIVTNAKKAIELAGAYSDVDPADYSTFTAFTATLSGLTDALEWQVDNITVDKIAIGTALGNIEVLLTGSPSPMSAAVEEITNAITGGTPPDTPNIIKEAGNKPMLQIGTSQMADMTLTGLELLGVGEDNIYHILGKAVSMLNGEASPEGLQGMVTLLQKAQNNVLTLSTKIGAIQNRMSFLSGRYDSSELNYTEMRSYAEDVDMAEAIINLTEAQMVYNAALAGGAEILKTSLVNFLR